MRCLRRSWTGCSLFKNILEIKGDRPYDAGPRAGERQTLREFFEMDGAEPDGMNADGSQRFRYCKRCRRENYAYFRELLEIHDQSLLSETAPRIISLTVRARWIETFVDELEEVGFVDKLGDEQAEVRVVIAELEAARCAACGRRAEGRDMI